MSEKALARDLCAFHTNLTTMFNISYKCGICQNYQIAIAILLTKIFGLLRLILLLIECLILVSDGM